MAVLSFDSIVTLIGDSVFNGSTTLAGLALMMAMWLICAVVLMNFRGSNPAYSIAILIPIALFFSAYGILNQTISVIIIIISSVLVAVEFRRVAG